MIDWPSFYAEAKTWQISIGSMLGFIGLAVAAMLNFYLNRRRDDRIRKQETLAVAAALYGEILLLQREAVLVGNSVIHLLHDEERYDKVRLDNEFVASRSFSEPVLYKALASKIGLLEARHVTAITEFHKLFQEARSWLPRLVRSPHRTFEYSVNYVLVPIRDAVAGVQPTLISIEALTGSEAAREHPDLSLIDEAIEMEQSKFQ